MSQKLIERLAVQSLVEHGGELIFSKEKFAELIVRECAQIGEDVDGNQITKQEILKHFGVEQ